MRWQNPWAWLGLLTIALPILVHLFSRRPARVEPFPSLRFLDVSRLLPTRRTQLTDRLLLLVRIAAVALAVAALAQPLWSISTSMTALSVARAIIIDTTSLRGDSLARAALERDVVGLERDPATTLRIASAAPHEVLEGAVAWLRMQRGRGELIVLSDYRRRAIDSLDLVSVPSDITVHLVRAPASRPPSGGVPDIGSGVTTVHWVQPLAPSRADVVRRAVRVLGGDGLTDTESVDASAHRVIVASPGADSLQAWLAIAQPLSTPWMGDMVYALRRDTTLASAAAAFEVMDRAVGKSEVVVVRDVNHSPIVTAAAINGADGNARLLLTSRAPAEALVTAALLLSASKTSALRSSDAVTAAGSGDTTPSDAQLREWEQLPAAVSRAAAVTRPVDVDSGPSDARFLWLAVLLLLAIETRLRRRAPSVPNTHDTPTTSAVTND